jgi:hypothetical protein
MTAPATFLCRRLPPAGAHITPEECEHYRSLPKPGRQLSKMKALELRRRGIDPDETMPPACEHCKDWPELIGRMKATAEGQPPAVWACARCKGVCGKPAARGLGWGCYRELKKAGRLDEFPAKHTGRRAWRAAPDRSGQLDKKGTLVKPEAVATNLEPEPESTPPRRRQPNRHRNTSRCPGRPDLGSGPCAI